MLVISEVRLTTLTTPAEPEAFAIRLSTTGGEEMHRLVTNEAPSGLLTLNFNDPGHTHSINGSTGVMSYTGGSGQCSSGGNEGSQGWSRMTATGSSTTGITSSLNDYGGNAYHSNNATAA